MRSMLVLAAGFLTLVACGGGDDPELACPNLDETACVADDSCLALVGGQVVDAACDSSQGPPSFQGCIDDPGGCDDVITVGTAPGGTQYRFPDSCVPDDFTSEACF